MNKSVYSIVLMDNVVSAIDKMAAEQNTSRSNMINRILAQQVCMPTAETKINDIYSSIEGFLNGHSSLAVQLLGSGSMINMRSALQYKYNPSVKYSVEILSQGDYIAVLKVNMRTQNQSLIHCLEGFFYNWAQLEQAYCELKTEDFSVFKGRYVRYLRLPTAENIDVCGESIAGYISVLDNCLKEYFNDFAMSAAVAKRNLQQLYIDNMTSVLSEL